MAPPDKREIAGQPFAGIPPAEVGRKITGATMGPLTPNPTDRDGSSPFKTEDLRRQEDSMYSPMDANELHRRSDVDSSKLAQHHTIGTTPNQAAAGNHRHDGIDSPELTFLQRRGWAPIWTGSGTVQPDLKQGGFLAGDYAVLGNITFVSFTWQAGSNTEYGNGDFRFSLPTPVASVGAYPMLSGYLINGGYRSFPVACNIEFSRINNIYPSGAKGSENTSLNHLGWGFAWQQYDRLRIQGWYWNA